MKKLIRIISGIAAVLSVLLFLYGSIEFSRVEAAEPLPKVDVDIPGVVFERQSAEEQDKESVQTLIGVSIVVFAVSVAGVVLSSSKNIE
ncbi:MAG: hypothetical protein H0X31_08600 [Nostocaceae cyanobacterium]|nr:hypothetical protein [Nostocaceae cyanobacterium]